MAKIIYECINCGKKYGRQPIGKCSNCGAFQQFREMNDVSSKDFSKAGLKTSGAIKPTKKVSVISELNKEPVKRTITGINELDRVLGGGFVDAEVALFIGAPGSGKALHKNTLIPLAEGGFKKLDEIQENEILIDTNGKKTRVLQKFFPKIKKSYNLTFNDMTTVKACEDHLWNIFSDNNFEEKTLSTSEIFKLFNNNTKLTISNPIINTYTNDFTHKDMYDYGINIIENSSYDNITKYLYSTLKTRIELLLGIIESSLQKDCDKRKNNFSTLLIKDNLSLTNFIKSLFSSMGISIEVKKHDNNVYSINYCIDDISFLVSSLSNDFVSLSDSSCNKYIVDMVEEKYDEYSFDYQCLMVDSDTHTFLCTESFITTHNSSLSLSIADKIAEKGSTVLYSSGEESEHQIGLRAQRMNVSNDNIKIVNETNLEMLLGYIDDINPDFVIVDSLQTLASADVSGSIGSVSQSKEAAHVLTKLAKDRKITMILINQILKNGESSGSNQVNHIVDCVLALESDTDTPLKFLRTTKNRFGDTTEVGVFQHSEKGLEEVSDPSGVLLDSTQDILAGTSCTFVSEGIRQIPVEIQALVTSSNIPTPRKQFTGINYNRGQIVCAILDKFCNLRLYDNDVFVNTVSGLKIDDPLADLSIAASIVSSAKNIAFNEKIAFVGELSLTGQVRGSFMVDNKIREAERLGFDTIFVPITAKKSIHYQPKKINVKYISSVKELLKLTKK